MIRRRVVAVVALCASSIGLGAQVVSSAPAAAAAAGGTISGTVTDASGTAQSGICVDVYPVGSSTMSASATTASDGTYSVTGLAAGSYDVQFEIGCGTTGNFVSQWYEAATSQSSATSVTVTATTGAAGIDAALTAGGTISGTVTESAGGSDLSGICVYAYPTTSPNSFASSAQSATDGEFSLIGLAAGDYYVEFSSNDCGNTTNYLTQWYPDEPSEDKASAISVIGGGTVTGINAAMVVSATIAGTVSLAGGGAASGVCVYAYPSINSDIGSGSATSGSNGSYTLTGLVTGSYYVEFSAGCGISGNYATVWYPGTTSSSDAVAVSATAGLTTSGIDATMSPGGSISGTVTDSSGSPLSDICVYAYGPSFGSASTSSSGTYTLNGLTGGSYDVEFFGCGSSDDYATQWYDGATSESSATEVAVTVGSTTSGINASMTEGGSISGTVTDGSGTALSGICVWASGEESSESTTTSSGTYTINGLPAGSYEVQFSSGCGNTGDYATQWYDGATSESSATEVAVTVGSTTSGINASMTAGGTISGTVTDSSGDALSGICVYVSGASYSSATTASDGTYSITGLTAGTYDVEFSTGCGNNGNYITQWYKNASSESSAKAVTVTAGATTSKVDAKMATGGIIAGTVTDTSGNALSGICVEAVSAGGGNDYEATTDAYGTYSLTGLPTGSYDVEFSTGAACGNVGNYLTQWYDGATSESTATAVSVTAPETTSTVNAAMGPGGSIGGTVTDSSGNALSGICVYASGPSTGYATTASNGTYSISGLAPGSYDVEFYTGCGNSGSYLTQWYDGASSESSATSVSVVAGATTSAIDAAMQTGGTISGTVTDSSGDALSGICVDAYGDNGSGFATTASNGTYSITGLAPGSYDVEFSTGCGNSGNYLTLWYKNASSEGSATAVSVTAGATTSKINAKLPAGGTISGTVTDSSGNALSGICVYASGDNGGGSATTASNGTYSITGLAAGSYQVEFDTGCGNSGNYLAQYYDGASSESSATSVSVAVGATTSGINAAMQTGGTISGTVTDSSGNALSGICVFASGDNGGGSTTTASNGTYSVTGLATGSYEVEFSTGCGNSGSYVTEYYDDTTSPASATSVSVTEGATTSGIDASMEAGGTIKGKVTDSSGNALSGICVDVSAGPSEGSTISASDGTYSITGLAPGDYQVDFVPGCGNTGSYVGQWYKASSEEGTATPVSVTAGATTSGINASLSAGGTISGTVTDSSGNPLSGICVDAYSADQYENLAVTGSDGTYSIPGLATGSYDVEFYADGCGNTGNYADQYYDGATSPTSATAVSVTSGATTSGIDASMEANGTISGTVTDSSGTALSGICVEAYGNDGYGTATTASDGTYSISGLAPGSYDVEFYADGCGSTGNYADQYYDGATSPTSATAVSVTSGTTTSGVNASMSAGGAITGTVTDSSGTALSGICVYATGNTSPSYTETGSNGKYTLDGLSAGDYDVEFSAECGNTGNYTTSWYEGSEFQVGAKPVKVSLGATTKLAKVELSSADGEISGTVTNGSGTALSGICVEADGYDGYGTATTASDGTYSITDLAPGSYKLEFSDCNNSLVYATEWYSASATYNSATEVTVSAGQTTSGIDMTMSVGGTVSGTVMTGKKTLYGICVTAYLAGTQTSVAFAESGVVGTYTLSGLPPGDYDVEFTSGCGDGGTYAQQWYEASSAESGATAVAVTAGGSTTGVDASMGSGGTIEGVVKKSGKPLSGVCVFAYQGQTVVGAYTTAPNGTYSIGDLATGSYDVLFAANCRGYVQGAEAVQWYKGALTESASTTVAVTAGKVTSGIGASLSPGGTVDGKVTGTASTDLGGVCVSAYDPGSSIAVASTTTTADGSYALDGLGASSYDIEFDPTCGGNYAGTGYSPQWYDDQTTSASANPVAVTPGKAVAGIDASL